MMCYNYTYGGTSMYITIEGPIGIGKSSLARLIKQELQYDIVNEIVTQNPFLERFYEDQERWALQTEMYFLSHRFIQLRTLAKRIEQGDDFVADFDIYKNEIFARKTLTDKDYTKFYQIYQIFRKELVCNDLTVLLHANLETIKYRIALRNRSFEQEIADDYLIYLIEAYQDFGKRLAKERPKNFLIIECDDLDYVHSNADREFVVTKIKNKIKRLQYDI